MADSQKSCYFYENMFCLDNKIWAPILMILGSCVSIVAQIAFEEKALEYNVLHKFTGATIGGGVSIYDFNRDGLDDLTLSSYAGQQLSFYINTGSGFELIPPLVNNTEIVKQINWVDYDNDGDSDLYIAANDGISRLYEQTGDLKFEDVTQSSGLPLNTHFGYGACWGDYNRDGWLDLYYASKGIIGDPDAIRSYNRLFKNNADGTFSERTFEADVSDEGKLPFCAAFLDYNNDMWPDIYIANDKLTYNTLLENTGGGTFEDVSVATGANARMNAMCVNPGDYNQDGWMDIYVTNTPVGSQYLKNSGTLNEDGFLELKNFAVDLGIDFRGGNCWGSNFLDADNDGDLDLYVSSSIPRPKLISSAFFENINHDHFIAPEIEGLLKDTSSSYSNAIGDINNDGNIDIVVQNNPPDNFFIWENKSVNDNNWVKLQLEGKLSNRDGIGARIEAYIGDLYQMQFTLCGSGFLGQNSSYKHIGIGAGTIIDSLVITWPTGHVDRFYDVVPHQTFKIIEGASTNGEITLEDGVEIVERNITTPTLQIENEEAIKIFPNPGNDFFIIESERKISHLEIYNLNGQLLDRRVIDDFRYNYNTKLWIPGVYIYKTIFDNATYAIKKWIKI